MVPVWLRHRHHGDLDPLAVVCAGSSDAQSLVSGVVAELLTAEDLLRDLLNLVSEICVSGLGHVHIHANQLTAESR
jgi:hypothetical protein